MAATSRTTRRSSLAAAAAAGAATAAAAGERMSTLRKRTRSGAGLDEGGARGEEAGPGERPPRAGKKVQQGQGAGKAPRKASGRKKTRKGRANKGPGLAPVEESAARDSSPEPFSMPGLVAAAVAAAEGEEKGEDDGVKDAAADDDDGDLSSLTSLSDLEPDSHPGPAHDPQPAVASSPRLVSAPDPDSNNSSDDSAGSVYVDDDDDVNDATVDPSDTRRATAGRSLRNRASRSANSSTSSRPPKLPGGTRTRPNAGKAPVVQVPSRRPKASSSKHVRVPAARPTNGSRRSSLPSQAQAIADARSSSISQGSTARRGSTEFRPRPMPTVHDLFEQRAKVMDQARAEATEDLTLQKRSEEAVESAVEALETGSQQTTLCLAMNRFSSWCSEPTVQLPVFPLTGPKLALFLARCTATPLASLLLSVYPQPHLYPLPVADCIDPNLTADEGNRLTRELFSCWVDALSYAQMATADVWFPVLASMYHHHLGGGGGGGVVEGDDAPQHPSLRPLHDDRAIQEVLGALEPAEHMQRHEARMRAQVGGEDVAEHSRGGGSEMGPPSGKGNGKGKGKAADQGGGSGAGKTKWVKGGKTVAPPAPLHRASSSSSGGSRSLAPHSTTWMGATPPGGDSLSRRQSSEWAPRLDVHVPRVNAFDPLDPCASLTSPGQRTFGGQLVDEPTFAAPSVNPAGEPFIAPPIASPPHLHRRSSTSNLALDPAMDTGAFPLDRHAIEAIAAAAVAATEGPLPHTNGGSNATQWQGAGGEAPARTRSVTHDPRLENGTSFSTLVASQPARAQRSFAPVQCSPPPVTESPALHRFVQLPQEGFVEDLYRMKQPRFVQAEEYDPHRPDLGDTRVGDAPRTRRPTMQSQREPQRHASLDGAAFVVIDGQRYELAQGPPPPDARLSLASGTPHYVDGTPMMEQMYSPPMPGPSRWSGGWTESRPSPRRGRGRLPSPPPPPPPHPPRRRGPPPSYPSLDHYAEREMVYASTYRTSPGQRHSGPTWTTLPVPPRQFVRLAPPPPPSYHQPYHQPVRGPPNRGYEPDRPRQAVYTLPPVDEEADQLAAASAAFDAVQRHLPHPAYASSYRSTPHPPSHHSSAEPSIPATSTQAAPLGALALPAAAKGPPKAYPTPESPSALLHGGELPGAGTPAAAPALRAQGVGGTDAPGELVGVPPAGASSSSAPLDAQLREPGGAEALQDSAAPRVGLGISLGEAPS